MPEEKPRATWVPGMGIFNVNQFLDMNSYHNVTTSLILGMQIC